MTSGLKSAPPKVLSSKWSAVAGVGFILAGLFLPSALLITFLRGAPPPELEDKLLFGAKLFKTGLVLLGIFIIVLGRLSIWRGGNKKRDTSSRSYPRFVLIMLIIILATFLLLSLYKLDAGLWIDEIIAFVKYANMPTGEIITTYDSQNLHPLFTLLAHASHSVFGTPWSLRFPAVLFGVACLGALFLFALQVGTWLEALFSVALLSFSYQQIWFSQNARGYTGLLFWTILSSWLFLRGLRDNQPKIWLFYALAAALGVYTHFTMLFVILGQFAAFFIEFYLRPKKEERPNKWIGLLAGFCLAGLLIFQFHALILPQIFGQASLEGTRSTVMTWKNPLWTALEFFRGLKNAFSGNIFVLILALIIFGTGFYDFIRKKPTVFYLLCFPPLIGLFVLKLLGHPLFPRTFFFTIGFMILVVIRGAMILGRGAQRLIRFASVCPNAMGVALCLGLVFVSALSVPKVYGPKQDYQGALAFIEESKMPGDQVVTVGFNASFPYQKLYHLNWPEAKTLDDLNAIRSRAMRTWLVYTISLHFENEYPEISGSLQRDFVVVKKFFGTLHDGTIYVCCSDRPPQT